jgi:hypothetical protein
VVLGTYSKRRNNCIGSSRAVGSVGRPVFLKPLIYESLAPLCESIKRLIAGLHQLILKHRYKL